MRTALISGTLVLLAAFPAAAQTRKPPPPKPRTTAAARARKPREREKFWISISGGAQAPSSTLTDTFTVPQFVENETIAVKYRSRVGALVAASGGIRLGKHFGVGAGISAAPLHGSADVAADVPHPFFFDQFRHIQGTTSLNRTETAASLVVAWTGPLTRSRRLRMILAAGPAAVHVSQPLVSGVEYSQSYPYDTATFVGVMTNQASRTALGIDASADVFWMVARQVGVGGLAQFVHARVQQNHGSGSNGRIQVSAGGAQVGLGIRFVFP